MLFQDLHNFCTTPLDITQAPSSLLALVVASMTYLITRVNQPQILQLYLGSACNWIFQHLNYWYQVHDLKHSTHNECILSYVEIGDPDIAHLAPCVPTLRTCSIRPN